jgi:tetratricopeptide (TPR) repeat protein
MRPFPVILLAVLLSGALCFAEIQLLRDRPVPPDLSPLQEKLEKVERRLSSLDSALNDLQQKAPLSAAPAAASRVSAHEIADEVARWFEKNGNGRADASGASLASASEKPSRPKVDLSSALHQLADDSIPWEKRDRIWKELRDAGLMDEAIAKIEAMAKGESSNADLQTFLGEAYLQKLFTVSDGPEKGTWAIKADQAFDAALGIDANHWEARFSKAVSLAFWPPIFNKQSEAMKQFETLVSQQEASGSTKEGYAQTYVFLGNLYQQQGKGDKALELWKKGAALFPDNAELKEKSSGASGK